MCVCVCVCVWHGPYGASLVCAAIAAAIQCCRAYVLYGMEAKDNYDQLTMEWAYICDDDENFSLG